MRSDYDYGDDYGIRVERTSPPRSPGRGRDQPRERERAGTVPDSGGAGIGVVQSLACVWDQ